MFKKGIALIVIIISIIISYKALLPSEVSTIDAPLNQFSTARALVHLAEISKKPHYIGLPEHQNLRSYIKKELEALGLDTHIQEGYSLSSWGNLVKPKNIIGRLEGREDGKALMLLTHYDSNPHSSLGASDAGSGVATILEGLRAFLAEQETPKNDIIVLISDAEELGLNGADLFVNRHDWAKDVGLVLNFEARGSGGPSYMLLETNGGNTNLMKGFVAANPKFPVANSLAYSLYKMLPNDTDLTVFRRDGDIDGFNFAFIDDHYDYHTALDTYERLDRNTLEHQGSYLMPLLSYFSSTNLEDLKSAEDVVYFNIPYWGTIMYPFSWIFPLLILAFLGFIALIAFGLKTQILKFKAIRKGFLLFYSLLGIVGVGTVLLWEIIIGIYPEYQEILQGFTYNGHSYIWAFVLLSLGLCFYGAHKFYHPLNTASLMLAPISAWLIICSILAVYLPGGSYFIIPVFFALSAVFVLIKLKRDHPILMALFCIPVLFIMSPLLKMLPVGLGLGALFISCLFTVLIFGFTLPLFGYFKHKNRWSYLLFFFGIVFILKAHFNSDFNAERPKPNSLIYILNSDTNSASWATYDRTLDAWTENFLGQSPDNTSLLVQNTFGSKYASGLSFSAKAPLKAIAQPKIEISQDTIIGDIRSFSLLITPQRQVHRLEVFADSTNRFLAFNINGLELKKAEDETSIFANRKQERLFGFHLGPQEVLEMHISVPKAQKTRFDLFEASFDLLEHPLFSIPKREKDMIPKPFVLNDAVINKKTLLID